MIDPVSIGLICFFAFSAGFSVYKETKEAETRAETRAVHRRERAARVKEERWEREQSTTKFDLADIRLFLTWFQGNTNLAPHLMEGVSGILDDPCSIPALDTHFEYENVVLTLSQTHSYALTIAANSRGTITRFWTEVNDYTS